MALIALYDSTDGRNWTYRWNLGQPVDTWYGIRVHKARVRSIILHNNHLVGSVPSQVVDLELDTFDLEGNQIESFALPQFLPGYRLRLAGNHLDFSDIEPHLANFSSSAGYSPQGLVRSGKHYERLLGDSLVLRVDVGGTNNQYEWFFNASPVASSAKDSLLLIGLAFSDTGNYFCQITNPAVPALVLRSGVDTLSISGRQLDSLALVGLYTAANGSHWRQDWNLSDPMDSWYGVTLAAGRVSKIALGGNGLRGMVPADLNVLGHLKTLDLADNDLDSLSDLSLLRAFIQVQNNRLSVEDIVPNLGLFKTLNSYSPQYIRVGQTYEEAIGDTFQLGIKLSGIGHHYQWFKDGSLLPGETDANLQVDSLALLDVGHYHVEVRHARVPSLIRLSGVDTLTISGRSIDSLALVALYEATDGPNWRITWNLNQPLHTWYGVRVKAGRVNELRLFSHKLKGSLPAEIGYLEKLTILELTDNALTGGLPASIGRLKNLHTLNIFENELSGILPTSLWQLDKLITLDIADNQFSGSLPAGIAGLKSLTTFYFMNNDFSGLIPPEIGQLTNLIRIDGENNRLSGTIPPQIGNLINLEHLYLCYNNLTGAIPPEVGKLTHLEILYLCDNDLSDDIPEEISKLINLVKLNLAGNALEGALPDSLQNLEKLTHLWVNDNKLDSVPDLSKLTSLVSVKIKNNKLDFEDVARVVEQLGEDVVDDGDELEMTIRQGKLYVRPHRGLLILGVNVRGSGNWYQWYFNGEELDGETSSTLAISAIEVEDTGLYHCEVINAKVADMVLSSVPDTLKMLPLSLDSLALVDLYNRAGGSGWSSGWDFRTSLESWSGVSIAGVRAWHLKSARVVGLHLEGQGLRGVLPSSLKTLTALDTLDLSHNPDIDHWQVLERLGNLGHLGLSSNDLEDVDSLDFRYLKKLKHLDLSDNTFSTAPTGLAVLTALEELWFENNDLTTFPALSHLTNLTNFRLENNRLDFEMVRPNLSHLTSYSPQRVGYGKRYYGDAATTFTFKAAAVRGSGHQYRWWHEDTFLPTQTADSLLLSALDISDAGLYRYEVRNASVPGLVLRSIPDTLHLSRTVSTEDSLALVSFFYSTHGLQWKRRWNLGQPVVFWHGVKTSGGRVAALDLPANRLDGSIPADIGRLDSLTRLNLSTNYIQISAGHLDSLPQLTYLNLASNGLDSIGFDLTGLPNLRHLDLASNRLSGRVPSVLTALSHLETLHLEDNAFTHLPDLSSLPQLTAMKVSNNQLHFSDLEPNMSKLASDSSRYMPQRVRRTWSHHREPGSVLTLQTYIRGSSNTYHWFKDSVELVGKTDSSLVLKGLELSDAGFYHCEVKNSKVPGLTYQVYHRVAVLGTVRVADSLALVALYNSTDGFNWRRTWNLSRPVSEWSGVTHQGGRVVKLSLAANGLKGAVPQEMLDLTALDTFYLQHNQLSNLTDLSSLANLKVLKVQDNYLDFGDLEPNLSPLQHSASNYHPQTIRNGVKYEEAKKSTWSVAVAVAGEGHSYQWFQNGLALVAQTKSRLTIVGLESGDAGLYHCEVRHGSIPDLVLASVPDTLLVNRTVSMVDSLALVALYKHTDGLHWHHRWNLGQPVETWYGVEIDSGRVGKLTLAGNNLKGGLPVQIVDLALLRVLKLGYNALDRLPKLSSLSRLEVFEVQENHLHFADLAPNLSLFKGVVASYRPQAPIREGQAYLRYAHHPLTLSVQVRGAGNIYRWFQNGKRVGDRAVLPLPFQLLAKDAYYCEVQNTSVPGLTLRSLPDTLVLTKTVVESDSLVLVEFYKRTDGTNWNNSWNLSKPVTTWAGVLVKQGKVVQVSLPNNQLSGLLPAELAKLDHLRVLDLAGNGLAGVLPDSLGYLALEVLNLSDNQLEGRVPVQANWSGLRVLNLAGNKLSGSLPREVYELRGLESLDVSNNELSGHLPVSLSYLSKLTTLKLASNQFSGAIPSALGNLQALEYLQLDDNLLSSVIPDALGDLSHLSYLSIARNRLTGSIPSGLKELTALQHLDLESNQLAGTIPAELGQLGKLKYFNLKSNQLSGAIPNSFVGLVSLYHLDLSLNRLEGSIPDGLANLAALAILKLGFNKLSGSVPAALGQLMKLKEVYLDHNALSSLPDWSSSLPALETFQVQYNYLDVEDLGPNLSKFKHLKAYSPQLIRLGASYRHEVGAAFKLKVTVSGSGNVYQWYFGERVLPSEVGAELRLSDLGVEQTGLYHCVVTNGALPGLVMQSLADSLIVQNASPIDIILSSVVIKENRAGGSLVGVLKTVDENAFDRHVYSLSGIDADHFKIEGGRLLSTYYFDYERDSIYEVVVMSQDRAGLSVSRSFTIRVLDELDGNQVIRSKSGKGSSEEDKVNVAVRNSPSVAGDYISLYPNPNAGILRILGLEEVEVLEVMVLNELGTVVRVYHDVQASYDLSTLTKGLYIVLIDADGKRTKLKLILR